MSALGISSLALAHNPVARVTRLKSIHIGILSEYLVCMKPPPFYWSPQPLSCP
jgi:hypothetical protein